MVIKIINLPIDKPHLVIYFYGMIAKLDVEMVNLLRKRHKLKTRDLVKLLGYKSRQGYAYMISSQSIAKVPELAKIFGVEKRALVIIDC